MSYVLREVNNKKDLKLWVEFPYKLYRNSKIYVPQFRFEQMKYFSKNPVYSVAEKQFFYVTNREEIVGRIAAFILKLEVEKLGVKRGRFGFFESINDKNVSDLLLNAAKDWLVNNGCTEMEGPHGFSDLDAEGLLIEGFDELPPVTSTYAMPYFREMLEGFGLIKEVDYIEHRISIPDRFPLYEKLKQKIAEAGEYRVLELKSMKDLYPYLDQFWPLLEKCYAHLHGVTPLTEEQKNDYTKNYIGFLNPEFVKVALDRSNKVVGFFIGMPSLSRAFQKAKGRIFPGILHVLKGMKTPDTLDFVLIGVDPDLPKKSIMMLLMGEMYESCHRTGVKFAESNRQLETNFTIADVWKRFDNRLHRRSRIYRMGL